MNIGFELGLGAVGLHGGWSFGMCIERGFGKENRRMKEEKKGITASRLGDYDKLVLRSY